MRPRWIIHHSHRSKKMPAETEAVCRAYFPEFYGCFPASLLTHFNQTRRQHRCAMLLKLKNNIWHYKKPEWEVTPCFLRHLMHIWKHVLLCHWKNSSEEESHMVRRRLPSLSKIFIILKRANKTSSIFYFHGSVWFANTDVHQPQRSLRELFCQSRERRHPQHHL